MQIVIIEDEKLTAEDLADTIHNIEPGIQIAAVLSSVKEALTYFRSAPQPDLIFSDIQLGDGLSFEIFAEIQMSVPVIFCTAFDEYALHAFNTNGIDYILKPFSEKTVDRAMQKYRNLKQTFSQSATIQYEDILNLFKEKSMATPEAILVYYKDKIIPIRIENIALLYLQNEQTQLRTFGGQTYLVNKGLEEMEGLLGGKFFRVNRQCLVARRAVADASTFFSRKLAVNLSVPFEDSIIVSKEKSPAFLKWLAGN